MATVFNVRFAKFALGAVAGLSFQKGHVNTFYRHSVRKRRFCAPRSFVFRSFRDEKYRELLDWKVAISTNAFTTLIVIIHFSVLLHNICISTRPEIWTRMLQIFGPAFLEIFCNPRAGYSPDGTNWRPKSEHNVS